jgi:hypothetical protein
MEIPTSFILIIVSYDKAFKPGNGAKVWDYVGKTALSHCV